jgi:hypothetical protein
MPVTNGSGFDSDPDPAIFVVDLQGANKIFPATTFLHHFSKIKSSKKSQNSSNQGFFA